MSPRGGGNSRGKSSNTSPSSTIGAKPMIIAVIAAAAATASPSTTTGAAPIAVANVGSTGCSAMGSSEQQQQQKTDAVPPLARPVLRHSSTSSSGNATNYRGSSGGGFSADLPRKLSRGGDDNAVFHRTPSLATATTAAAAFGDSRDEPGQATSKTPHAGDSSSAGSSSRTPPRQCDEHIRPPYASVGRRKSSRTSDVDCVGVRSGGGGASVRKDSLASCTSDNATRKPSLRDEKARGEAEGGAAAATTIIQPRRPSDVRRSKLLEGRPRAVAMGEQGAQAGDTADSAVKNDAAIRAPVNNTAVRVPISDTDSGCLSESQPPRAEVVPAAAVDNVSAIAAAKTTSGAVALPEDESRSRGNRNSRSDVSSGEVLVPTTVGRSEAGVDAALVAVAPGCHVEAAASQCNRGQGNKSTEPAVTESYAIEEYASDLFESDSHVSLLPP